MRALLLLTLFFVTTSFATKIDPTTILGVWKTGEGTAHIQIVQNGSTFQGKIIWLRDPNDPATGKPKTDQKHPDAKVRNRPIIGLTNVWGFTYKGDGVWEDGKIYDPKNGKTYDCVIKLKDNNTLSVRGYIGVTLIGRTDLWTRQAN